MPELPRRVVPRQAPGVIRALFLDAAGTLIHPTEPVGEVYARIASAHGRPTDATAVGASFARVFASGLPDPEWHRHPDGDRAERAWWRELVARVFSRPGSPAWPGFDACFDALFGHYAKPEAWQVYPEVPGFLERVGSLGLRTAVVSNFDRRLHRILAGHGLRFDLVLASADARCRKPGAAIFQSALDPLGLVPEEACHIGDSRDADLEGAQAAGLGAFLLERPATDLHAALDSLPAGRIRAS